MEAFFVGCGTQVIAYNVAGTKEPKTVIFCKNKCFVVIHVYDKSLIIKEEAKPIKINAVIYCHANATIFGGCSVNINIQQDGNLIAWNSVHGDLIGAFRTGLAKGISQFVLKDDSTLVGGTCHSSLVLWKTFETKMSLI